VHNLVRVSRLNHKWLILKERRLVELMFVKLLGLFPPPEGSITGFLWNWAQKEIKKEQMFYCPYISLFKVSNQSGRKGGWCIYINI